MNQPVKITKRVVDNAPIPTEKSQLFIRDSQLPGFALRVTRNGVKSFIVEKRINGKVRRHTLGRYGQLTTEQARGMAQAYLGQIAYGRDPIAEQKTAQVRAITLAEAFAEFVKVRKNLKPKTLHDYRYHLEHYLGTWLHKPITSISKQAVSRRHKQIGERSPAQANAVFRTLKSVLNFARHHYEDGSGEPILAYNPVEVLDYTRAWYPARARQQVIKEYELRPWYEAVQSLRAPDKPASSHVIADFLEFVLFTGLRFSEAAQLRWDQVDLQDHTLHLPDPKNRRPFTLPLTDHVERILQRRAEQQVNAYVFPSRDGAGPLVEPRRQMQHVTAQSGVKFTVHDLRRTFSTIATVCGLPHETVKRLINHQTGDVTSKHYIVSHAEQLRGPAQQVTDYLKHHCGIDAPDNVISLPRRHHE